MASSKSTEEHQPVHNEKQRQEIIDKHLKLFEYPVSESQPSIMKPPSSDNGKRMIEKHQLEKTMVEYVSFPESPELMAIDQHSFDTFMMELMFKKQKLDS